MNDYLETRLDKFEFRVRKGYLYNAEDMWLSVEAQRVRVGVSDYLQRKGGDIAFVELAEPGSSIEKGAELGTMETAKTTVSLHSPVSGIIEEVNGVLAKRPELVNSDPYGERWPGIVTPAKLRNDLMTLLDANAYFKLMLTKLETEQKRRESM